MSGLASIGSPQPPRLAPAVPGWSPLLNHPLSMPLSLLVITLVAYAPALLHGGFVWDDHALLTNNPFVRAAGGLPYIWGSTRLLDYFPLTSTSLWLEWRLWGMHAWGYHLDNILLHAGSAILLWRGLRLLPIPGAALAALIFAVHPVNVESVAWIAERKNTLSMFFYALAFWLYQRFELASPATAPGVSGWKWYWLALGAFGLSLLSKTATVMFPGVLLLCAWWRRGKITWRDAWQTLPFFATAAVLSLVTIWFQRHAIRGDVVQTAGFAGRLAAAGWAVWFYLYKAVLPLNLMFVYPRWQVDPHSIRAWLPLAALTGCLVVFWWRRRSWGRPLLFALGYFLLMLFPVAGFFNIYFQRYSLVADHWQYFSIISVIALAVAAGDRLARKTNAVWWGCLCGAWVVTAFCALTWQQSEIYHNEETLWRATLARNPECWMAHNNLGIILAGQGQWAEAMQHYERALQLGPDTAEVRCNLGGALAGQGKLADAIQQYQRALQLDPGYAEANNDWGDALAALGKWPEAAQQYERVVQLAPGLVEGHYNLAVVLAAQGKFAEAAPHYEQALHLNPDFPQAHINLGVALAAQGKWAEAIQHYQQALKINPDFVEAHCNLAAALTAQGNLAEAIAHLNRAIALRPGYALAHYRYGIALAHGGESVDALAQFQQALDLATAQGNAQLAEAARAQLKANPPASTNSQTP
ncbi:MAG: tetratricopeptide repeat protein [Verrucomicrobiota bacterium]|jgi:tetratricopeptide (TPR) repeat protein